MQIGGTTTAEGLTWGRRVGYAFGDLGFNLYWQGVGLFLYFFYTEVMGIPPGWAGVAYGVASIWDGISDPIMGSIADRSQTRWGKFRPYLLLGAVPCAAAFALTFWVPPLQGALLIAYAMITHIALRTFYTMMNIPYIALTARMTTSGAERGTLSGLRMLFASSGGLLVSFGLPQLVEWFGPDPKTAWALSAGVLAVAATAIFVTCFAVTQEAPMAGAGVSPLRAAGEALRAFGGDLRHFWGMLRRNGPLARVFAATIVSSMAIAMFPKTLLYWLKYGLERPDITKWVLAIPALTMIPMVAIWVWLSRRASKRVAWMTGSSIAGVGYLAFFFNHSASVPLTVGLAVWIAIGASASPVMFWATLPDTVEYNEWKLGVRDEAKIVGFAVFAQKLAFAANAMILGQLLQALGFEANHPQSAATLAGIKAVMCLVPLAGVLITLGVLWRYPLDPVTHRQLVGEIATRRPSEAESLV